MEGGFDRQTVYGAHCRLEERAYQAPVKLQLQTTTQKSN